MADEEKHRITVRSDDVELRGVITGRANVIAVAKALEPLGVMVVASPLPEGESKWDAIKRPDAQ